MRERLGVRVATELVRGAVDAARRAVLSGTAAQVPDEDTLAAAAVRGAEALLAARARRVINATGVILHTNLGRAPLSERAARAVAETLEGYCSIELDLATGKRGRRGAFLEAALCALFGAEAALVVNNCAGAVLLLLAATARGRPVVVSRGELVEIGGGFRVPEIMAESGATLVEVGTTNRTRLADYERALDEHPDAAALLRVHQGNFRQLGFVERPPLHELGALARARGTLLLKDLGGGAAVELGEAGFPGEPLVQACVEAGCTAVTFSTDKVLGGPQGGVIVGAATILDRVRKHPLARALRLGRLPMVALEATLEAYLLGCARQEIPTLAMAHAPLNELQDRASDWARQLELRGITCQLTSSETEMGGGTLAARTVPSVAVGLAGTADLGLDEIARRLRAFDPPVAARVTEGALLLDARTVRADEDAALIRAVVAAYNA